MLILSLLAVTAVTVNARCGTGFVQGPSLADCYKFVTKGAHWYAAEWRCVSLGGHLASVSDAIESSFLEEEVPSCCPGYYWLGGSNDDHDGLWEWSDGSQFSYVNWEALPATDDVCPAPPATCTDDAKAESTCICGYSTCTTGQYCHTTNNPQCLDVCVSGGVVSGTSCQCVPYYDGDEGDICADSQTCNADGTCSVPSTPTRSPTTSSRWTPTTCTDDAQTGSTCTCGNTICTPYQYCHTRSDMKCFDVCTSGSVVSGIVCQCVPSVNDGDGTICFVGQTCSAYGTCGVFSTTSTLPTPQTSSDDAETYIACLCGYSTCTAGQYCHTESNPQCLDVCAFGSMGLPACTDDAKVPTACICGYSTCMAGQYCYTTSNPPCLDVCESAGVVWGTSCQCVDVYGDDGDICTDGQTCHDDGSCWVSSTSTQSTTTTWKYK